MGTHTITFSLDVKSIGKAITELKKFQEDFKRKCERLRKLIGERIAWSASAGFRTALVSDIVFGEEPTNDVEVSVEDNGNVTVVMASGSQAVFIEFGAGVYNNGPVGTSPHPWGTYTIGSYGKGNGAKKAWGYYSVGGGVTVTHGTPAAMPMYHGLQDTLRVMDDLVREVFG